MSKVYHALVCFVMDCFTAGSTDGDLLEVFRRNHAVYDQKLVNMACEEAEDTLRATGVM